MIAANDVVAALLAASVASALLEPPVNVLRLSLRPDGLASRIRNLPEWRKHLLDRLRHQISVTADPVLVRLMGELQAIAYCDGDEPARRTMPDSSDVFVPLELEMPFGRLSFFSTTTLFGTPVDVTLSEIAIESFFPADEETRRLLQALAAGGGR